MTIVSVVALGIGISAVTTQFSVINGIFFKGLPFEESHRLVHLERINVERDNYEDEVPIPEYLSWVELQEVFEQLSAYFVGTANLTYKSTVERYDGCFLTPDSFAALRVKALLGRGLQASDGEPDAPHVVLLSYKVWKAHFGADPDIIGEEVVLNSRPATVVGVMEEGFAYPTVEEVWVPLFNQQERHPMGHPGAHMSVEVFGRLKDGVSYEQARSQMAVIAANLEQAYPDLQKGFRDVRVEPMLQEFVGGREVRQLTAVMLLITVLILVIACANVANLLLARTMQRQKEVAIRSALGASRGRIVAQFLTESTLVAVLGSVLAVVLTLFDTSDINDALVEMNSPYWMSFSLDWRVFLVVAVATVATGLLSGVMPAYRASRLNESEILKDDNRTGTSLHIGKFSKALVVVQISVSAVILTLVVLFTKSVSNAIQIDYTYAADEVLSARIGLFEQSYPDAQSRANLVDSLLRALRARPEVAAASTTHRYRFMEGPGINYSLPGEVHNNPGEQRFSRFQYVSPDFLETMRLPLVRGRAFLAGDFLDTQPRRVIVNRDFAEREWPGENPVGKQFLPDFGLVETGTHQPGLVEVIGVVDSMQESPIFRDPSEDGAAFLAPQTVDSMPRFITIVARTSGDPAALAGIFREEVAKLDRNLPIYTVGTPRQLNDEALFQLRYFTSIFRQFGILATLLAAVGIYGVITFSVNRRIAEFGIRQALGATRAAVFKLVLGHALKQLALGFLIALALLSPLILSPGIKETLALFFYEIDHNSMMPYLFSFGFVTLISILAAAPPAYRASRIQPAQALRYE